MTIALLFRFREIVPSCLKLDDVISRDDIIKMVNVAFKIVGYSPRNLEESVDWVVSHPNNYAIDLLKNSETENPENQGSPVSISLGSSIIENPKNLGDLFYEIYGVDVRG